MNTATLIALPYAALGLCVGPLVGITGVGGGSLMTPLLILLLASTPSPPSAPTCSSRPPQSRSERS